MAVPSLRLHCCLFVSCHCQLLTPDISFAFGFDESGHLRCPAHIVGADARVYKLAVPAAGGGSRQANHSTAGFEAPLDRPGHARRHDQPEQQSTADAAIDSVWQLCTVGGGDCSTDYSSSSRRQSEAEAVIQPLGADQLGSRVKTAGDLVAETHQDKVFDSLFYL